MKPTNAVICLVAASVVSFAAGIFLGNRLGRELDPEIQVDPGDVSAAAQQHYGAARSDTQAQDDELLLDGDTGSRQPHKRSGVDGLDEAAKQLWKSRLYEEIEGEVVAKLEEALGADWGSDIRPPSVGSGPYVGGVRHGEWEIFHPKSNITDKGTFLLGAQHGEWTASDPNGNIIRVRTFSNGKLHGLMKDRLSIHDPWRYYEYQNGELVEK